MSDPYHDFFVTGSISASEAFGLFSNLCDAGDDQACFYAGWIAEKKLDKPSIAEEKYEAGLDRGSLPSAYRLSMMHINHKLPDCDGEYAHKTLKEISKRGHYPAKLALTKIKLKDAGILNKFCLFVSIIYLWLAMSVVVVTNQNSDKIKF